jgi:hypothetical protein
MSASIFAVIRKLKKFIVVLMILREAQNHKKEKFS